MSPLLIIAVLSFVLFGFIGHTVMNWGSGKNSEKIERRKAAQVLVSAFDNAGLHKIADFLGDYVIGDYVTMYNKIHNLAIAVKAMGADAIMGEAEGIFKKVLNSKLASAEGRAWLTTLIAEATPGPAPKGPTEIAK